MVTASLGGGAGSQGAELQIRHENMTETSPLKGDSGQTTVNKSGVFKAPLHRFIVQNAHRILLGLKLQSEDILFGSSKVCLRSWTWFEGPDCDS